MAGPEFEDLLHEGHGGPAADCEECRMLLDALAYVDETFDAAFARVSAPPGLAAAVRARVAREIPLRNPSPLPEVLDFIGWAAVLAMIAIVVPRFLPFLSGVLAALG